MTDFIVKSGKSPEELLQEAKARGAVIVRDTDETQGFAEDFTDDPSYNDPAVLDLEKRMQDSKPAEEVLELTQKFQENNANAVRKFRFLRQEEYTEELWERGRVLWMGEFLRMLQTIRPDAFLAEYSYLGLRGLGFIVNSKPQYSGVSVHDGMSAEWSLLKVDTHGLPTRERYRGWRTVLLALIQREFVMEDRVYEVFGKPTGPRSRPWWRQLYMLRNSRCPECGMDVCICADAYDFLRADAYQYALPDGVAAGKQQVIERPSDLIWTP